MGHHHHDHAHEHGQAHDHGHAAHHGARATGWAFAFGVAVNGAFVVVEIVYGVLAHSTALLADAAHNASDVLGLLLAWGATALARRRPSRTHTYGLRRSTILAALANAMLLLVTVGGVAREAIGRLLTPAPVHGWTVLTVAAIGVIVNGASALPFLRAGARDANVRGAFLHLAADAAVSLAVVVSGVLMLRTGWTWLDPAAGLLVSVVVLVGTWGLLKDALRLSLDAVPGRIDPDGVRAYLAALPDVKEVHDLHIWAMSTTEVALTAHLVMPWSTCPPQLLADVSRELAERFDIAHATLQIEPSEAPAGCALAPDHVV